MNGRRGGGRGPGTGTPWAKNQRVGQIGEDLALQYLERHGMTVIDRNWRCPSGEIDLVLLDGEQVVFCEVKTRRSAAFGMPLEAVTEVKAARLRRLAYAWLSAHDTWADSFRVDLVGILFGTPVGTAREAADPDHWPIQDLQHLRGVA